MFLWSLAKRNCLLNNTVIGTKTNLILKELKIVGNQTCVQWQYKKITLQQWYREDAMGSWRGRTRRDKGRKFSWSWAVLKGKQELARQNVEWGRTRKVYQRKHRAKTELGESMGLWEITSISRSVAHESLLYQMWAPPKAKHPDFLLNPL